MRRHNVPSLEWEERDGVQHAGPYAIVLEGQQQWRLLAKGRPVGLYPTRTAARHDAADHQRRTKAKRRLGRYLVAVLVTLGGLALALTSQSEPNPEYPPARAFADRLDEARDAVESGEIGIDQIGPTYGDLDGAAFQHAGLLKIGVTGVLDGDCYGIVWRQGFRASMVFRTEWETCRPDRSIIDQPDPRGLMPVVMAPSWDLTLPEPERSPVWFIPLLVVSIAGLLGSLVRIPPLLIALRK